MANDPMERCIACGGVLLDDDMVFDDVDGGSLHERCCGPERECYVNLETGEPLKDGEPTPKPYRYGTLFGDVRATEQLTNSQRDGNA